MKKEKNPTREGEATKPIDSSLLTNDELRPWTVDHVLEERLSKQMEDLEQTISFTSPQKACGQRGDSVLDIPTPQILHCKQTLQDTLKSSGKFNNTFERRFEPYATAMRARGVDFISHTQRAEIISAEERERKTKTNSETHKLSGSTERRASGVAVAFSPRPEQRSRSPSHASLPPVYDEKPKPQVQETDADALLAERLQAQLRKEGRRAQAHTLRARPGTVPTVRYHDSSNSALLSMRRREIETLSSPHETQVSPPSTRTLPHYQGTTRSAMLTHSSSPKNLPLHSFPSTLSKSLSNSFSDHTLSSTASFKYMNALKHHTQSMSFNNNDIDDEYDVKRGSVAVTGFGLSSSGRSLLVKTLSPLKSPTRSSARKK